MPLGDNGNHSLDLSMRGSMGTPHASSVVSPPTSKGVEESFDVLNANGVPTGQRAPRSAVHRLGYWHATFHAFLVFDDPNRGPTGLFQWRARSKDHFPGLLDATVTGHLAAGETVGDGVREIREETGLVVSYDALIPLRRRYSPFDDPISGRRDYEIQHAHLWRRPTCPEELSTPPREVEGWVAMALEEGLRLLSGAVDCTRQPYWAKVDGLTRRVEDRDIRREDFIPSEDHYFYHLMRVGLAHLRGEKEVML